MKKQDDMRHKLQNPKVKYFIGDVRNKESIDTRNAWSGLCILRCSFEASTKLWILSYGSNPH